MQSDQYRANSTPPIFGVDVDGLRPGQPVVVDDAVVGWPARSLKDIPAGDYFVQALLDALRDVPSRRRPHDQDADGPGRRAALGVEAGQLLQHAGEDAHRSRGRRRDRDLDGPGDPADRAADRHGAGEVPPRPERAAHEILGPADVARRHRAAAERLGHASQTRTIRCSSTTGTFPRDMASDGWRETPPDPKATAAQRAAAGRRIPVLQGLERAELPAHDSRARPASHAVLRRLVRGELGEQRSVRRRDHQGSDSVRSRSSSAASARAGRASSPADRPAAGRRSACR